MATSYIVLRMHGAVDADEPTYGFVGAAQGHNALVACKKVADVVLSEEDLDAGVTLIAVPERSWTAGRHDLRAETRRIIR